MNDRHRPAIVMMHGMFGHGAVWDRVRNHFEARGHRVLTPTLPHHGYSPDAPPHPDLGTQSLMDYTDHLEREIRAFDADAVLFGYSMGGLLAQKIAARGLGSKLVLLGPAPAAGLNPFEPDPTRAFLKTALRPFFWRRPHRPDWKTARWGVFNGGVSEAEAQAAYDAHVWESGRVVFELAFWFLDRRRAARIDYDSIDIPVLILTGSEDRVAPSAWSRAMAQRFKSPSCFEELTGLGHWLLGPPAFGQVAPRIEAFLAETEKAVAA